jgi:hypothetical protein
VKIKVEKFCALSTSPSWQAWLYHFDENLYKDFHRKIQNARGCNHNREIMSDLLKMIDEIPGAAEKLIDFLKQHYPTVLINDDGSKHRVTPAVAVPKDAEIFEHYNPDILTYPRRLILTGEPEGLKKRTQEFLLDKLKSDFVFLGDRAYIEYIPREDAHIKDQIPTKNWRIAAWRLRTSS